MYGAIGNAFRTIAHVRVLGDVNFSRFVEASAAETDVSYDPTTAVTD